MTGAAASGSLRIDKWLWHARLCKTRSLAGRLCAAGAVELGGTLVARAAQPVRVGDFLTVTHGGWQRRLEVAALGTRRGGAAEARTLYHEIGATVRLSRIDPDWVALLSDEAESP
jgi:ribosome-associated heat shock protein Hsp15